jgi:hypothetical protein
LAGRIKGVEISIYPNSAIGLFVLNLSALENVKGVRSVDFLGRTVFLPKDLTSGEVMIDFHDQMDREYVAKFHTEEHLYCGRIV